MIEKCCTCKHSFSTGKDRWYCKKSLADKDDCKNYEMATYEITAELNLKEFIDETREVAQALNELADNLEQIKRKYAESHEVEEKSCSNCKFWCLDKNDSRRCQYCYHQDEWQAESEDKA